MPCDAVFRVGAALPMSGRWIVGTLLAGTFVAVAQDAAEFCRKGTQLFDQHKPAAAIAVLEQSVTLS